MRVISGSARGKILQPVPGMQTRPTTDRVKESVFNIIQMQVRDAVVLDLFAGTGQLGIEALSRGAKKAYFVDQNKTAQQVIRKNLQAARVDDRASLYAGTAQQFLERCDKKSVNLIFLDPPYGGKLLQEALFQIQRFDILATNGIIICESAVDDIWQSPFGDGREYRYGAIKVTVFRAADSDDAPEN